MNGNSDAITLKGGDTLTAPGSNLTVDISGTGNGAAVKSAKVTLENGAGATVTGNGNTITETSNASAGGELWNRHTRYPDCDGHGQ